MIHTLNTTRARALGAASGSVDCGFWAGFTQYFDLNLTSSDYLANRYECSQYGTMPQVTDIPGPTPGAPQTQAQMSTPGAWTPLDSATQGNSNYTAAVTAHIQSAIDSGSYNPAGNGLNATWFSDNKWLLIAAAAVAGVVVLKVVK